MQHVGALQPPLEAVAAAYAQHPSATLVPLYREFIADMDTPLTILLKLRAHAARGGGHAHHCFLLESVEGGERLARYSFVGAAPRGVIAVGPPGTPGCTHGAGDPLAPLEAAFAGCRLLPVPGHDLPAFAGGAVGYVGYDCVRYFEPRVAPLVEAQPVALGVPEALFMLIDTMVVFDHVRHTIKVVAHARLPGAPGDAAALAAAYAAAAGEIEALQLQLAAPVPPMQLLSAPGLQSPQRGGGGGGGGGSAASRSYPSSPSSPRGLAAAQPVLQPSPLHPAGAPPLPPPSAPAWEAHSNLGREGYEGIVRTLQGHIVDGDIIQAVASQRISRPLPPGSTVTALDMYRQLRLLNPSPYMFYLECGEGFTVRLRARFFLAPRRPCTLLLNFPRAPPPPPPADCGRLARDAGQGGARGRVPPRRHARGGRGAGCRAAGRRQGARRAHYAGGPGAQRHWARGGGWQRARGLADAH